MHREIGSEDFAALYVVGVIILAAICLAAATTYARVTRKSPYRALVGLLIAVAQVLFEWLMPKGRHTNYDEATSVEALKTALNDEKEREIASAVTQVIPVVSEPATRPTLTCAPQESTAAGVGCTPQEPQKTRSVHRAPVEANFLDHFDPPYEEQPTKRAFPSAKEIMDTCTDVAAWPPTSGDLPMRSVEQRDPKRARPYVAIPEQTSGRHALREHTEIPESVSI
ncbi:hypothetical protein [Amycolatopsis sp. lyj-23]|uniref:hypothetical protein n=1 Tax=Amycolatopsis sp. lyj-23 TaxID=2789283 RepID=UPI00397A8EF1